ncbi:hypothetical protein [Streptomyces sp. NPDC037389]|uniref:hypothetical protein n=1 Tax=Streptomyces sp. NPDC037389 TaxID=3155369 RepID=UPI0033D8AC80
MIPRAPRTIQVIADALDPERRPELYRLVLTTEAGPELHNLIATWWGHAMLDTDPDRERIIAAAEVGTLPTVSMDAVLKLRHAR